MNSLSTNEKIGIAAALLVVALLLGGSWFAGFFPSQQQATSDVQSAQTEQGAAMQAITIPPATTNPDKPTMQNVTELQVSDVKLGTGTEVKEGSKASVLYKGMLTDGTVFDASSLHGNTPFDFTVGAGMVIKGWDQGLLGMKVGGQRRLVIPSSLGYGPQGMGPIPGGATLVFDVELVSVK